MTNQTTNTITLPRFAVREKEGVVVLPLKKWRNIEKENLELRLAIEAIFSGEIALRENRTRTFREFLKSEFSQYAKNL